MEVIIDFEGNFTYGEQILGQLKGNDFSSALKIISGMRDINYCQFTVVAQCDLDHIFEQYSGKELYFEVIIKAVAGAINRFFIHPHLTIYEKGNPKVIQFSENELSLILNTVVCAQSFEYRAVAEHEQKELRYGKGVWVFDVVVNYFRTQDIIRMCGMTARKNKENLVPEINYEGDGYSHKIIKIREKAWIKRPWFRMGCSLAKNTSPAIEVWYYDEFTCRYGWEIMDRWIYRMYNRLMNFFAISG
jgi:hypothetical protein